MTRAPGAIDPEKSEREEPGEKRKATAAEAVPGGTVGEDLVSEVFNRMRAAVRAGGRRPPSLKLQTEAPARPGVSARVPGLDTGEDSAAPAPDAASEIPGRGAGLPAPRRKRRPGIPTGRDGYIVPRRREVDSVGTLLGREMKRRGWTGQLAGGWITGHWELLVGEKIAQHTRVEMVKDSTVFITCDSTAWATNLRYMQREILKQIGRYVGPEVVTKVNIFGPKAPSWRKGRLHVKGRGPRDTYG